MSDISVSFAILEARREQEPNIFSLSFVTFPEVCAKVDSAQFPLISKVANLRFMQLAPDTVLDKCNNKTSLYIKSLKCGLAFKMKTTEEYFGALPCIVLYTFFLTFKSVDHKNLKGVESNKSDFSNNFPVPFK